MYSLPKGVVVYAPSGSAADIYVQKYNSEYTRYTFVSNGHIAVKKIPASEPKGKVSPKKAMEILEDAILSLDVKRVPQIIEKHKTFELSARALGLACRTGCLDIVKCLVENKFNFSYKTTDKTLNSKYALYYKPSSYKYHADFSLLMIVSDIWDRYLFGYMEKRFPPEDIQLEWAPYTKNEKITSRLPESLLLGSSKERTEVIKYLYNKKKISDVKCKVLLYYAILEDDDKIVDLLESMGATLNVPWLDAEQYDSSYVSEYNRFLATLSKKTNEEQKHIFTNLNKFMRRSGQKFNVRESLFDAVNCYHDSELAKLVLENADTKAINKKKIITHLINIDVNIDSLSEFLNAGFADAKLLCELIEIARNLELTELQIFLMNYKNIKDN